MKNLKILYISNGSNFLGAGGMEYHLIDITQWLERKGVQTALAVRKNTYWHRTLLAGKPNVYPLSWTGLSKITSMYEVVKTIRDTSPDIISINRERDIVRIVLIVKLLGFFFKKRPKLVSVFHNSGWKKWPMILSLLDGMIFPNKFLTDIYAPGGHLGKAAISVIHHGIHLPVVDAAEKLNPRRQRKFFLGREFPIIGMVGELRKNQSELIDVAYHLVKKVPEFTMAIVGRGHDDEMKRLQNKIDRLGLTKHFILTGNVDRSLIPDIFFDLDISVTTNRREPFGLVFIESLAFHTPLVAYDTGGPVEILEKGGGVLVHGGPGEMAGQLARLIMNHETLRSYGMAGRAAAEQHFSIDAMGEKHYAFYRGLLQKRHAGSVG